MFHSGHCNTNKLIRLTQGNIFMKEPQQPTKTKSILSLSRSQVNSQPNYISETSEENAGEKNGDSSFIWHVFSIRGIFCFAIPVSPKIKKIPVGGFNPSEKYESNCIISPGIGVKMKNCLKPPPRISFKKKNSC